MTTCDGDVVIVKIKLLEIFVHWILHVDCDMSSYDGKMTVNLPVGLLVGKFIVNYTFILSSFFKLEGIT